MALGLKYGRSAAEDAESKENMYRLTAELVKAFRSRFGSAGCVDLLGCDIGTPEGMASFKERDLHAEVCARVVADAAEEAYRLLVAGSVDDAPG